MATFVLQGVKVWHVAASPTVWHQDATPTVWHADKDVESAHD